MITAAREVSTDSDEDGKRNERKRAGDSMKEQKRQAMQAYAAAGFPNPTAKQIAFYLLYGRIWQEPIKKA